MTPAPSTAALGELTDVLGADGARTAVRMFLETFPPMMHELARGDRERSRRAAHGLKSSARQMGATALADYMAALEKKLMHPDERVTASDLAAAAVKFSETAEALRTFVRTGR